jgi:transposase InsO family protein
MRYPASEKLEIIRLVEQSHLPVRRTLEKLGILPGSFYRWVDRYQTGGVEALEDKPSKPSRVWNRIPDDVRRTIIEMALDEPELSPRELATRFTDTQGYFVSEASVYRLLKAHDLITSPAFIVIKAADEFKDKTTAVNQLWQTDFTYLKVIRWGWFYLSTILNDYSRYIIAWKLCTTMKAEDVTDTLQLALAASGCDQARVVHKPRLLSDHGSSYVSADLAEWLDDTAWITSVARPITRKPRARSSAGIRHSRTASCWRITICPVIAKPRSDASSSTTITAATTRAWPTSHRPTSTLGEGKPSCCKEKGSNATPSGNDDCSTKRKPLNIQPT